MFTEATMPTTDQDRLSTPLLKLAGVVMLGALMMQLDMTMTTIATKTLLDQFHATLATVQWVGTGYLLAMTTVIPLAGWALERYGARTVWMASLITFLAGSVLCGLSGSIETLIAARVVQGLGGGMILPLAQAVLAQAAGPRRLGRVMAAIGVPSLLGPVLGPVIGGVIVSDLSWRWIFFVNVPICVVALAAAWRLMPTERAAVRSRLDVIGLLLLSTGSATLIFGFAEAGRRGDLAGATVLVPGVAGVLLLVLFVAYAWRAAQPLIDLRLFRSRGYAASIGAMFLVTIVLFGAMGLLPLFYQQVRHETALQTGLLLIPFGVGMGLSLVVAGRLSDRVAPRGIAVVGLLLTAGATVIFTQLGREPGSVLLGVAQILTGGGVGALLVPIMAAALRDLPSAAIPRASTTLRIFQQLGGSFGSAVLFIALQHQLSDHGPGSTAAAAYGATFWWSLAFAAAAFVPVLLLPGRRRSPVAVAQAVESGPGADPAREQTAGSIVD
jgi:EmrB/QacA subfamily drug resistance transporter